MSDILDNDELTYIISHDFKEPLRMISSYLNLLERKYGNTLDDDAVSYIQYASDGANRLKTMLEDLLVYSGLMKEKIKLAKINVSEMLESVKKDLDKKHNQGEYEIKFNRENLKEITGDKFQMYLLFSNIIDNSLKFNRDSRKQVNINAEEKDSFLYFCISDNGFGIDEVYHERIFKLFQKLHNHAEFEGSGIGLAICRKIVENHGGKIWIESEPNKGTKVFFRLPN